MQFTDSYAFLSTSLSELSNNLKKHEKINTYNYFNNLYDENIIDELLKKGVYCYDYINNFEKLKLNYLPEKKYFYSKMNEHHIFDNEYERALNIWKLTNCKNMEDYTMIYLYCDVLLLIMMLLRFNMIFCDLNKVYYNCLRCYHHLYKGSIIIS